MESRSVVLLLLFVYFVLRGRVGVELAYLRVCEGILVYRCYRRWSCWLVLRLLFVYLSVSNKVVSVLLLPNYIHHL